MELGKDRSIYDIIEKSTFIQKLPHARCPHNHKFTPNMQMEPQFTKAIDRPEFLVPMPTQLAPIQCCGGIPLTTEFIKDGSTTPSAIPRATSTSPVPPFPVAAGCAPDIPDPHINTVSTSTTPK